MILLVNYNIIFVVKTLVFINRLLFAFFSVFFPTQTDAARRAAGSWAVSLLLPRPQRSPPRVAREAHRRH